MKVKSFFPPSVKSESPLAQSKSPRKRRLPSPQSSTLRALELHRSLPSREEGITARERSQLPPLQCQPLRLPFDPFRRRSMPRCGEPSIRKVSKLPAQHLLEVRPLSLIPSTVASPRTMLSVSSSSHSFSQRLLTLNEMQTSCGMSLGGSPSS